MARPRPPEKEVRAPWNPADDVPSVDVSDYLRSCVTIEPLQLQEEFVRVPADLAYWAARKADLKKALQIQKLERDKSVTERDRALRAELAAAGEKVTEVLLDRKLREDAGVRAANEVLIAAEHELDRAEAAVDAVRKKGDMLVALGALQRAEMARSNPTVRDTGGLG